MNAQAQLKHTDGEGTTIARVDTSRGYFSLTGEGRQPCEVDEDGYIVDDDPDGYNREPDGYDPDTDAPFVIHCCGQMHPELLRLFPQLAPIAALHLASTDTGEPMHGSANGLYWLHGVLDPLGLGPVQYGPTDPRKHGLSTHTPEKCREILAAHLRVGVGEVDALAASIVEAWGPQDPFCTPRYKMKAIAANVWATYYAAQLPRFKREALAGLELIASL